MRRLSRVVCLLALGFCVWIPGHAQNLASDATALSLFMAEDCSSTTRRGRCGIAFMQAPKGEEPSVKVIRTCAPGWLAHIVAQRGTVESGGVNTGQAMVCGHEEPEQAIRALLLACDNQTLGICQDANHVDLQWAFWSGDEQDLQALPMNRPLAISTLPQSSRCDSDVPLVESDLCPPESAVLLRNAGLR